MISTKMDLSPAANPGMDRDFDVYKTLLESTMAIPWKLDWASMRFTYIGPQIETLLGWEQGSWVSIEDWALRIHPEDRDSIVNFCISHSSAGIDHEADYRALTKDDGFVWIRDVVHVVRNEQGQVDSLIGFMFDISERKRIEHELIAMQQKLEALSFEDGLTSASNRRRFDQRLVEEWEQACNSRHPLSMILLDIDNFKQFNDYYGHIQGDECLVAVAAALKQIGCRANDVVARYGGEEFVLLLPETDEASALELARQCQQSIEGLAIPHVESDCSGFVTASFGVGTIIPTAEANPKDFCKMVDRMLYVAKQNGRNQIKPA